MIELYSTESPAQSPIGLVFYGSQLERFKISPNNSSRAFSNVENMCDFQPFRRGCPIDIGTGSTQADAGRMSGLTSAPPSLSGDRTHIDWKGPL